MSEEHTPFKMKGFSGFGNTPLKGMGSAWGGAKSRYKSGRKSEKLYGPYGAKSKMLGDQAWRPTTETEREIHATKGSLAQSGDYRARSMMDAEYGRHIDKTSTGTEGLQSTSQGGAINYDQVDEYKAEQERIAGGGERDMEWEKAFNEKWDLGMERDDWNV